MGDPGERDAQIRSAQEIALAFKDRPGALMPVLHAVQARLGYVPAHVVGAIAQALNLSRAEVHGVLTFYRDFRMRPPGRHIIRLCRAESCQALGSALLAAHVMGRLGVGFGATTDDGGYSLEAVNCLGNCACSPAMMIDEQPYGRVTAQGFDRVMARLEGREK